MKRILAPILIALTFSVMFSSVSFAEWTKVGVVSGNTFYVDFERIRKHGGYVYWWELVDYLKPNKYGTLSAKVYNQGDCKLFRVNRLSLSFRKEPMGRGTGDEYTPPEKWLYAPPNSTMEVILKSVCGR